MKYLPIYILFILFIGACTRDLNVPLPKHEAKLTLNAFIGEGFPIDLYVSRSFGLQERTSPSEIAVMDAKVEIWKNGDLLGEMQFVDTTVTDTTGYYQTQDTLVYFIRDLGGAKYIPPENTPNAELGDSYKFVVSHPIYGEAQAETTVPSLPQINRAHVVRDSLSFTTIDGYTDYWSALKVNLDDPAGLGDHYNFYMGIEFSAYNNYQDTSLGRYTYTDWTFPISEILRDPDGYTYGENNPLSDEEFDGTRVNQILWFYFPMSYTYGPDGVQMEEREYHKITLKPVKLTEAYAKFQEKFQLQRSSRIDGIASAFVPSEPVIVTGNVQGGYGLVGAYSLGGDIIIELE